MDIKIQLTNIITGSTDPEELKNRITKEIAIALNASQCYFIEYDSNINNFKKIANLYTLKREPLSLLGYDVENNLKYLAVKLKYMKYLVIEDTNLFIKNNKLENTKEYQYFIDFDVKAFMAVRLEFSKNFIGLLVVHYDFPKSHLKEKDLKILIDAAEHTSIALHLSKLYLDEKNKKEREELLREIVSIISQDYDLDKISKKIFNILGKVYNAQSIFVNIDTDNFKNFYKYNFSKYQSNEFKDYEKKSLITIYNNPYTDIIKNKTNYIGNTHQFIIQNNLENTPIEKYFNKNNVKSLILLPILHEFLSYGLLIIHFDKTNPITTEDLELLKIITNQLGIAIKQVQLYKKEQETANREIILRDIISKIRSSLNIEEIKHEIANQIGMFFNADGVHIAHYNYDLGDYIITKDSEYRSSEKLRSWVGVKFKKIPGFVDNITNIHLQGEDIIFNDLEKYLDDNNLRGTGVEKFYRHFGFTSSAAINIYYGDKYVGDFVVTFEHLRKFSDDEIQFLKTLANQAGVAIHQAELYEKEKKAASREKLIGNILSKSISTFDINQIKQLVTEIGILMKADRCYFVEVDLSGMGGKPIDHDSEYLASSDIKSMVGYKFLAQDVQLFVEMYLKARDLIVFDYEEIAKNKEKEYEGMNRYSSMSKLKSGVGVPFIYMDKLTAVLCIEYVNEKILPSKDELDFLRILGNQVGMTFNQIQLFQNTKLTAEREITLRNLIETIRSTLNFNETKISIVNEVGKALNADRVFLVEFDPETNTPGVLDKYSEYLASPDLYSLVGYDFSNPEVDFLSKIHKNAKPVIVQDTDKFISDNNLQDTPVNDWFNRTDMKSGVGIAIFYGKKVYGVLSIHYTKEKVYITDEQINFLKTLANQAGIAIYQARLLEKEKKTAERELLLRKTTEIIRSSLDIKEIKHNFVTELGKILGADRVFIVEFNSKTQKYGVLDEYSQYLSSPDEEGFIGYDFSSPEVEHLANILKQGKTFYIPDAEVYVKENHLEGTPIGNWLKNQKSGHGNPIVYGGKYYGVLIMHYTKAVTILPQEQLDFISTLAEQVGTAFYQAELYDKEKTTAESEGLLRRITETIRSSLDINAIKNTIVTEICKVLNADRCFIIEYNQSNDKFIPVENEYLSSPDLKSSICFDLNNEAKELEDINRNGGDLIITDIDKYIDENNLYNTPAEEHLREYNVQSGFSIPIFYYNQMLGILIIHYTSRKGGFSEEEVQLVKTLASQIAIALHQAELFDKEKRTAEREITLRETIKVIRSTLDTEKIKKYFLETACNYFNADRCLFDNYDKETNKFLPFDIEILTKNGIKSLIGTSVENDFPEFAAKLKDKKRNIIIKDLKKTLSRKKLQNYKAVETLQNSDTKSDYGLIVQYRNEILGILILHYVQDKRILTPEEMDFLKILRDQAGIALYQAELYKKEKQTAERESLLREITEAIRSSLDINEIKSKITFEIGKALNADRCVIMEYDSAKRRFLDVDEYSQYVIDEEIGTHKGFSLEDEELSGFRDLFFNQRKELLLSDVGNPSEYVDQSILNKLKELNVKSNYTVFITYGDQFLGILYLNYIKQKRIFSTEEIELFRSLASQSAIALNQAELFEKEKKTAQREAFLRGITETIRSSLDIGETLAFICEETAKLFNVQRAAIAAYVEKEHHRGLLVNKEYKTSETLQSITDMENYQKIGVYWGEELLKSNKALAFDNIQDSNTPDYFKNTYISMGVKSIIGITIRKGKDIYGALILSAYDNYRHWTDEEKLLFETITSQIYIAINQAKLFDKEKKTSEREALLREIAEKIRSSLDLDETLSFICEETAKLFNVQRTAIAQFPNPENFEEYMIKKEYKSSPETRGIAQAENFPKAAAYWGTILMKSSGILAFNNIEKSETPDYFKNTYNSMGIKSMIGTSIRKGKEVWGTLVLSEYNDYREWTDEEKILLNAIANQVYIAINQAELFDKEQKKAENEKTLREIMLSSVSSFEIEKILNSIVTEAGKLFKADRCFFIEIDLETMSNFPIQDYAEYLSSNEIRSHLTRQPTKDDTIIFIELAKQKKIVFENNVETADLPEATRKMLVDDLSVKSNLVVPVYFGDFLYGTIVIQYVQDFKYFTQDEIDMAIAIANQSAIVIHQAELYQITKVQAEREKISKNIIEILRSTLDKSIIKRLFVKNIGKFFDADRVIFSEFNPETNIYNPVDNSSEYLSVPDIKSFVGYDWSVPEAQDYVHSLLEKREFHIYNWEEYLQGNFMSQDFINLFESMGAKSSYSFPVIHQQKMLGFFSIQFIRNIRRLMDEDINRIRNICTQAGIAFYHADLYEKAQKSIHAHAEFVNKLSTELKDPLNMIIEFSEMESSHEAECHEELEHLNNVNNNAKKLLFLLDDIIKNAKAEIDFN